LRDRPAPPAAANICPFLEESQVQYCSAAPLIKYLPLKEILSSACGSGAYRYCEFFLAPRLQEENRREPAEEEGGRQVNGIRVPRGLAYTANHMWIDLAEPGRCHIGVDAFTSQVLGSLEGLVFVTASGEHDPTVLLNTGSVDLPMTFPQRIEISRTNPTLRLHPDRVILDPYGLGWLFEGRVGQSDPSGEERAPLVRAPESLVWMRQEVDRLLAFLGDLDASQLRLEPGPGEGSLIPAGGLIRHLSREGALLLFSEFFAVRSKSIH